MTVTVILCICMILSYIIIVAAMLKVVRPIGVMDFSLLYDKSNNPYVTIKDSNGNDMTLMIDTGASYSVFNSKEVEERLSYIDTGHKVSTASFNAENYLDNSMILAVVNINEKPVKMVFQVTDMTNTIGYIYKNTGIRISGLIGSDFLDTYNYVLDYENKIAYVKR